MGRELTAWLSIGSTYSYLTAMRLKEECLKEEINLTIVPISIRQIMKNMDDIPFPPSKKTKVDYMWKDIERRAKLYKIQVPLVPAPYPLVEFDRANLVGIVMNDQGLYLDYFKYTYEEWFLNGNEAGSEKNLEVVLEKLIVDLKETIKKSGLMESRYIENSQKALQFGIFGVPSFSFSNEIFWRDDRLEDAVHLLP
jgi:2-hydroxychromene-2-carboxylate isomerase